MTQILKNTSPNTNYIYILILFLCSLKLVAQQDSTLVKKESKSSISFRDTSDNAFDMSSFLLDHQGLLPVPTLVTEPALGYGGGLALMYFHNRKKKYSSYVPPNVSGAIGLATANKTWVVGAFHSHVFGENRVRTMTAILKPNIHIDYYGNNSELLNKNPLTVKLYSWLVYQKAQVRLGESHFYLGASYSYFKTNLSLDTIPGKPLINEIIKKLNKNSVVSTFTPMFLYDSRNNVFTPTKGINAELSLNYSAQWLGSDDDYGILNTNFYGYFPLSRRLFSGWRFNGSYLLGEAPFYTYPYVSLRGIPLMRYQSDNVLVGETEWRYNVYKRWSVVGFSGLGKAFQDMGNFNDIDWSYTVGTGFRYEMARLLGIHMGTDFAWGNGKDFAFYIVFGTSW